MCQVKKFQGLFHLARDTCTVNAITSKEQKHQINVCQFHYQNITVQTVLLYFVAIVVDYVGQKNELSKQENWGTGDRKIWNTYKYEVEKYST